MTLGIVNFYCDVGADWQRQVRLRDPTSQELVALSGAVMEIRNANFQLALRLDAASGRCLVLDDGATISLHIPPEDSLAVFAHGNYPGQYQAIGIWGIGRSYLYDLYATYEEGAQDRILRGYFYVNPNITKVPSNGNGAQPPTPPTADLTGIVLESLTPNPIVPFSVGVLSGTGLDKVEYLIVKDMGDWGSYGPPIYSDSIMERTPTMLRFQFQHQSLGGVNTFLYAMDSSGRIAHSYVPVTVQAIPTGSGVQTITPYSAPIGTVLNLHGLQGLAGVTELDFWPDASLGLPPVIVPANQFQSQTDTDIDVAVPTGLPTGGISVVIRPIGTPSGNSSFQIP